jgi:hypothetical protein
MTMVTRTVDDLRAQLRAEAARVSQLLAMLPCEELFEMDGTELAEAFDQIELISAEMIESSKRQQALLEQIIKGGR